MGEVFRAEDTKLGREVAIKILPEAVAQDAERLARFEREAKVLASLNHPHIAGIYSIESDDIPNDVGEPLVGSREGASPSPTRVHYLVMELAAGEDLRALESRCPVARTAPLAAPDAELLREVLQTARCVLAVPR